MFPRFYQLPIKGSDTVDLENQKLVVRGFQRFFVTTGRVHGVHTKWITENIKWNGVMARAFANGDVNNDWHYLDSYGNPLIVCEQGEPTWDRW
jgi:hypothetical protein